MMLKGGKNKKIRHIIIGCCLSASATIAYKYNINVIVLLSTICYVCYAMLQPVESSIFFVAMAIPNTRVLGMFDISASIMICALTACRMLLMNKYKIKRSLMICLTLFMVVSFQFCFRPSGITYGIVFPLKMILVLLYFHEFISFLPARRNGIIKDTCDYLLCGAVVLLCLSVLLSSYVRLSVIKNDSNILAIEMAFIVAAYCVLYLTQAYVTQKNFFVVCGICSVIIFATGSRMGWLLLAIIFAITMIMNFHHLNKMLIPLFLLLIVGCIVLSSDIGNSVVSTMVERSNAMSSRGDVSNGRFDLWTSYYTVLTSDWLNALFGIGGNYSAYGIESVAHNFVLEDWASYGIIGIVILLFVYFPMYKSVKRSASEGNKARLCAWLPLCVPIVGGLTLHGLTSIPNTLMLFVGMIIACEKKGAQKSLTKVESNALVGRAEVQRIC